MNTPALHNHRMDYSNNTLSTFNRMDFIMDGKNVYTTSYPEVMQNDHSKTTFSENLIPLLKKKFLAHLIHPEPPKEQPATIYKNYYSLPPPKYTLIEKEVEKKPKKKKPKKKKKKPEKEKDVKYIIKNDYSYNDKYIGKEKEKGKSKKKDEHWYDGWNPFSCDEKEEEEEEHYDHKKYHYEHKEEEEEEEEEEKDKKEESASEEESEEDEHSWKRKSKKLKSKLKKKKKLLVKILIGLFLFFAFKCLLETYFYYFFPSFTTTGRDEEYLTEENVEDLASHQDEIYQQRKLFIPKCGNKHQRRFGFNS